MSIRLVFNGGFFVVHPGTGQAKLVDVLMVNCEPISVNRDVDGLAEALENAERIDFETTSNLDPSELRIREISHVVPIAYRDFTRVVSFNGGRVFYKRPEVDVTEAETEFNALGARKDADFFTKIAGTAHNGGHLERKLYDEFYAQANAGQLARWVQGYVVVVEFPSAKIQIYKKGGHQMKEIKEEVSTVEFQFTASSRIPHYPRSNPHVLEQPPTI